MGVHSLLHRHVRSGIVTERKRVDEPPRAGRLHRGFVRTSATKTRHNNHVRVARMAQWACCYVGESDGGRSMRPSSLSVLRSDGQAGLPAEVERLLREVVADGFVLYCCGPRAAPFALVAAYQWKDYVDLVTIRCFDRVTTARVPVPHHGRVDVFTPEVVVWAYEGPPQRALQALLDLIHPHQHPHAPARLRPAPPSLCVPRAEQRPMTIQFPPPGRAGMRAARLAAAMAAMK
jgi:hypothetical protein